MYLTWLADRRVSRARPLVSDRLWSDNPLILQKAGNLLAKCAGKHVHAGKWCISPLKFCHKHSIYMRIDIKGRFDFLKVTNNCLMNIYLSISKEKRENLPIQIYKKIHKKILQTDIRLNFLNRKKNKKKLNKSYYINHYQRYYICIFSYIKTLKIFQ